MEDTPEVYRFQTPVKAGETKTFTVKEERDVAASVQLTNNADDTDPLLHQPDRGQPRAQAEAQGGAEDEGRVGRGSRASWQQVVADLQRLNADQDRIRKNLRETPKEAEVYETYLKKLTDQEKEIDALTAKQKKLMADEFEARKKYDDFLANISD